jgi:hypothetical protein
MTFQLPQVRRTLFFTSIVADIVQVDGRCEMARGHTFRVRPRYVRVLRISDVLYVV